MKLSGCSVKCLSLNILTIMEVPDIKVLMADAFISEISILNKHIASGITQLLAHCLEGKPGRPTHEGPLLGSPG